MVDAEEIEPTGAGRSARYRLPGRATLHYELSGLREDEVWKDVVASDERLGQLPANVISIHRYVFTEMLNNAIDHSRGTSVIVSRTWRDDRLMFELEDDGIGAFRNVRERLDLEDEFAALQEISKGKTTTDPRHHTGQGIFFSSKAVDVFILEANRLRWIVNNLLNDQAAGSGSSRRGTRVAWELSLHTARTLKEVFDAYSDPESLDFSRSRATVRLFETGTSFVSRSEAKRLTEGLDRFEEVDVDFTGVDEVGQGFVDEVFRVWAQDHPDVRLNPIGMSPAVEAMIRRGLPTPD